MNSVIRLTSTLFFFLISIHLSAQSNYIKVNKDTAYYGVKILDRLDREYAEQVEVEDQFGVRVLNTDDIIEYGIGKRTFVAREIIENGKPNRVFMELLFNEEYQLLSYSGGKRKVFYISSSKIKLQELKRDQQYKKTLTSIASTDYLKTQAQLTSYNKHSLTRFLRDDFARHESLLPIRKIGIRTTYQIATLEINNPTMPLGQILSPLINSEELLMENMEFGSSHSVGIGIMAEFPINSSQTSFYTGVNFSSMNFEGKYVSSEEIKEIKSSMTSINIPIHIKLNTRGKKIRLFAKAGPNIIINDSNRTQFTNTEILNSGSIITTPGIQNIIGNSVFGYEGAIGIQKRVSLRSDFSFELSYFQSLGSSTIYNLNMLSFSLDFNI